MSESLNLYQTVIINALQTIEDTLLYKIDNSIENSIDNSKGNIKFPDSFKSLKFPLIDFYKFDTQVMVKHFR